MALINSFMKPKATYKFGDVNLNDWASKNTSILFDPRKAPTMMKGMSLPNDSNQDLFWSNPSSSLNVDTKLNVDNAFMNTVSNINPPAANNSWFDMKGRGGFLVGAGQIGLGIYNAIEQAKINDFMRGYYGDQMARQKTDFENSAHSANQALSARQERVYGASTGNAPGTTQNIADNLAFMNKWGVKEKYA